MVHYYSTFKTQIELLPRITIYYAKGDLKVVGFEWLWFGICFYFYKSTTFLN